MWYINYISMRSLHLKKRAARCFRRDKDKAKKSPGRNSRYKQRSPRIFLVPGKDHGYGTTEIVRMTREAGQLRKRVAEERHNFDVGVMDFLPAVQIHVDGLLDAVYRFNEITDEKGQ